MNYYYQHNFNMTTRIIKETFEHINNNWKEEYYETCYIEWEQIQQFISNEPTPYQCGNCNTYWTKITYINDHDNICPKCDTHCQPFLCNPINYQSVLKYINSVYHEYLLPPDLLYCKRCYTTDMPSENYCHYCEDAMCEICLDLQYTKSFHKCDECKRQWCYYNGCGADYKCEKIGIHSTNCDECGL